MTKQNQACLQARVLNCLQTILELESQLSVLLPEGHALLKDFYELKKAAKRLPQLNLQEAEALRIEQATSQFLHELKIPLNLNINKDNKSVLQ